MGDFAIEKAGFRSACNGGSCVEVAIGTVVSVRSSMARGRVVVFTRDEWADFVKGVKAGLFDIK
ncbi:DUF397 domain-containing protein [Sphaerisporangium sp. B11E5]|uniref:DUF397 domain-containing protein n=1 Tax=Sphaerisporangium sp. B11E5 TaxID=3153563 RepID=UPI00325C4B68